MKYFVLSVVGHEWYEPRWFASEKSKEEFADAVRDSVDIALPNIIKTVEKEEDYVDGRRILEAIIPLIEDRGFSWIVAEGEVNIGGDLSYGYCKSDAAHKPPCFSDRAWKLILEHNENRHQKHNRECHERYVNFQKEEADNAMGDRI